MSTIEVQLPDHLANYVESRVKSQGFSSASDLIISLISTVSARQKEVEDRLIDGLDSGPAVPWDSSELQAIKMRIQSRDS